MDRDLNAVSAIVGASAARAITGLKEFFGVFPWVGQLHRRLRLLMEHECGDDEPDCVAVIGDTGTGKTRLLKYFAQQWPPIEHAEYREVPVLYAQVPAKCSVKMLCGVLLRALGSPFWNKGDEAERTDQLVVLLKACKVRLVLLDEVNHLADRGAQKTHYHVGDWIKQLSGLARVPVVLAGTPAALILWETNEQLADRYREVYRLRQLSITPRRMRELRSCLRAFTQVIKEVDCIDLSQWSHARAMWFATDGRLRDIKTLMVRAVQIAASKKTFAITRSTFAEAFADVIYPGAPLGRNPFLPNFNDKPLTAFGEPFAPRRPHK